MISRIADRIDASVDALGRAVSWLTALLVLLAFGLVLVRYLFGTGSIAGQEAVLWLHSLVFLLGAAYALRHGQHVRVDLLYGMASERTRIWIDILGGFLFLLPICVILIYFTWPWFVESWRINEASSNAGGLIRWPVKLLLPVGFALMALQGISEIIKRFAALKHVIEPEFKYEKPLQ